MIRSAFGKKKNEEFFLNFCGVRYSGLGNDAPAARIIVFDPLKSNNTARKISSGQQVSRRTGSKVGRTRKNGGAQEVPDH
jgi:hypothetical protein